MCKQSIKGRQPETCVQNSDGVKAMATRFEGCGHVDVTIERVKDLEDPSVPIACRITVIGREEPIRVPDDTIWLDDINDLQVLYDAIGSYLEMMAENRKKGGDQ